MLENITWLLCLAILKDYTYSSITRISFPTYCLITCVILRSLRSMISLVTIFLSTIVFPKGQYAFVLGAVQELIYLSKANFFVFHYTTNN